MPSLNHVHTYERMRKPQQQYFRCLHPDCSHYINRAFLPGKRATCACGEEFILTNEDLYLKNPHCAYCGKNPQPRLRLEEDTDHLNSEEMESNYE
jgi:hypothetical protein